MTDFKKDERPGTETGSFSRRSFLAQSTALGAAAALTPALLSGRAQAATPNKGGHLRAGMGHGSTTDSLDPATFENGFMNNALCYAVFNHIAEIDQNGELAPELAESWEASDDAATWVFKVRPGVEFHSGKTVVADDIVASVNHHRGEDSKSAAKPLLEQLASNEPIVAEVRKKDGTREQIEVDPSVFGME